MSQATPTTYPVRTSPNHTVGDLRNGRYRFARKLGQGAYGAVYLAQDTDLKRQVAVKVPKREALEKLIDIDSYLKEAQNVAALDHPHIVTVYDVGRTLDGSIYVVSKFIDGCSLADWIKKQTLDFRTIAKMLTQIAEALHHAHQRRLIHRDIKPANILIDESTGTPYVADFGLAIREEDYLQDGRIAGTPAYMSPEQVRGEGHRLDGRSDLFSRGVVMYQMLTGRMPFPGLTYHEIAHEITSVEPATPRTHKSDIPAELERICFKLLRKRASERYANGRELAEDLRAWLSPTGSQLLAASAQRITPRGLRSFTAEDAGFFLDLLPGPRNRDGLPESIVFWKERIEQRDPDQTFTVGLLYGPSGCGKSSLVKAGLIPSLSPEVIAIYIEATPEETESRLLRQLRKRLPELEQDLDLAQTAERIRRSEGPKVVLLIDQFEQWLYSHRVDVDGELDRALRQCDGGRLQAVLMIRDDFYLAAARLMNQIDVPIVTDQNFKLVDLFDTDHARRVFTRFGESYDKLPLGASKQTPEQQAFVSSVVEGLSENKKVVSVRLSLLADLLKGRDWVPSTLDAIGGLDGIGISFLEETFASSRADARHRAHQIAVRGILRALLPELGTDIKGSMRSEEELLEASGYGNRRSEFQDLMRILDGELRLLTPTDPEGHDSQSGSDVPPRRYYQLTHDYLVPSLREWLTRKQRETKKGRAELKLAERAAVWSANKENKQLPTVVEWFQIRYWTDKKGWTVPERSLMRTAARVHAQNWGSSILVLALLVGIIGSVFHQQSLRSQQEKITFALDSLQKTLGPAVPVNIEKLIEMNRPDLIRPELERRYADAKESKEQLSLAFGLASFGRVEVEYLMSQIDDIEDRDKANFIAALGNDRETSIQKLRHAASECRSEALWKRKARLAMAALGLGDTALPIDTCEFEGRTDHGARTWFIYEFPSWELDLKRLGATVRDSTSPALRSAVALGLGQIPVKQISTEEKNMAAELVARWYALPDSSTRSAVAWLMGEWGITVPTLPDANQMAEDRNWFVNSQGVTFVRIAPKPIDRKTLTDPLEKYRQRLSEIDSMPLEEQNQPTNRYARGEALYQIGRYEPALADFDAVLNMELDDSMARARGEIEQFRLFALARLKRTVEADVAFAQWMASEPDAVYRDYVESLVPLWLGRKEVAIARLEQGLAGSDSADRGVLYNLACAIALVAASGSATEEERRSWIDQSLTLLERWSQDNDQDQSQMRKDVDFIALHSDPRFIELAVERPNIPEQPYWLANREVTRGEYQAFLNDISDTGEMPDNAEKPDPWISPTLSHPAQNVSWYDAVMYCNWLSRSEGRTPVYRVIGKEKIKENNNREVEVDRWALDETADGYRLPREMEWEYACRAGSNTVWSTGSDGSLLASYCQMYPMKGTSPCGKKLPNAWGVHDMHGNIWEWCWDRVKDSRGLVCVRGGGSWDSVAENCESADWLWSTPLNFGNYGGFRLALSSSGIP